MGRFFGAALLTVAVLLGWYAWSVVPQAIAFQFDGVIAAGTVVTVEMDTSDDGAPVFRPRVEYVAADGTAHSFVSRNGADNAARYGVGDAVGVRYLAQAPDTASIDRFSEIWGASLALCALLLLSTVVSVRLLLGGELWDRHVWIGPLRHWHGLRLIGVALLLAGIGLAWATWNAADTSLTLKLRGLEAEGTVIDLVSYSVSHADAVGNRMSRIYVVYRPLIAFTTVDGRSLTLLAQLGDTIRQNETLETPRYAVGETVKLRYLRDRPEQAQVQGFLENGWQPLFTGLFALIFIALGWFLARSD